MSTKLVTKTFICTGDIIETSVVQVENTSTGAVSDAVITVEIPPGVQFSYANLSKGSFNSTTNEWSLNTLKVHQIEQGVFYWRVLDDCKAPFKFTFAAPPNVCINSQPTACITIDGLTSCQVGLFKGVKTIAQDYTAGLFDSTILVNASANPITITLPDPLTMWEPTKGGGTEWTIKNINLDNSITIESPDGVIVDLSNLTDATNSLDFSIPGQTYQIQSAGSFYIVKTI